MIELHSIRPNTVNVLIGANGSGKSRLLRELCARALHRGENVIAIAPTIYDRFRRMRGLRFFGARLGRSAASWVVRSALERASSGNPQVLKNLIRALAYTNFDPSVGIKVSNLKIENLFAKRDDASDEVPPELYGGSFSTTDANISVDLGALESALLKWEKRADEHGIVRLKLDSYSFDEIDSLSFALIARNDDFLRKTNTARVEYVLYRKDAPIPLLEACSGELCFITTVAFISTQIEQGSLIAIDEPETSLHPTWQQAYVEKLLDLFHHYQPRILVSTHSPIIISGAEAASREVSVYEMANGEAKIFDHAKLSLEEMYDKLFGLITPKNHYLSQRAVALLNDLNAGRRSLNNVTTELEELREKSYDNSQRQLIGKLEAMARELESLSRRED